MPLSQAGLQAALASQTGKVFLECLTFTHSQSDTVRLVNDTQDLTRSAGVFARFPFTVKAPTQSSDQMPQISITADMVDQRLMIALRSLAGRRERAQITYDIVLADSPNTVEYPARTFLFDSLNTDGVTQVTIKATFLKSALNDQFPYGQFAPSNVAAA